MPSIGAKMLNREFLVFLFLFVMTVVYWGFIVANEQYEGDVRIPVKLVGQPKDVILLDGSVDTLVVNLRETRGDFLDYASNPPTPVVIQFSKYKHDNEVVVSNVELQKLVKQKLHKSTKINSIKRESLVFRFNHGQHKVVPVKFIGNVRTKDQYDIIIEPENVTVYAQDDFLKKIKEIKTVEQNYEVKEPVTTKIKLDVPEACNCIPSYVNVTIMPIIYIERTMEIPVECINEPTNKKLRLFPSRVAVTFMVDMNMKNILEEGMFRIVADYNNVADRSHDKCRLELLQSPTFVKNVKLAFDETDYLIEER